MKNLVVILAVVGAFQTVNANELEPVLVKQIEQSGNLMPGPGVGKKARTALTLNVESGGCTNAEDFKVEVQDKAKVQLLKVVRLQQDLCKAYLPNGVDVELSVPGLKPHKPVQILNPLKIEEHFAY